MEYKYGRRRNISKSDDLYNSSYKTKPPIVVCVWSSNWRVGLLH